MQGFSEKLLTMVLSEGGVVSLIAVALLGFIGFGVYSLVSFLKWQAGQHAEEREKWRKSFETQAEVQARMQGETNQVLREFSTSISTAISLMGQKRG